MLGPALPSVLAILHASSGSGSGGGRGGAASAALLRLVAAALEVLATELGSEAVEQLLGALVQIFGAAGGLRRAAAVGSGVAMAGRVC